MVLWWFSWLPSDYIWQEIRFDCYAGVHFGMLFYLDCYNGLWDKNLHLFHLKPVTRGPVTWQSLYFKMALVKLKKTLLFLIITVNFHIWTPVFKIVLKCQTIIFWVWVELIDDLQDRMNWGIMSLKCSNSCTSKWSLAFSKEISHCYWVIFSLFRPGSRSYILV